MEKIGQKRSLLNKLKEMTDVGGIATEKYFNPEFKEIMDQLRQIDDQVRSIASGEGVGEGSAPEDPISLKDLLKSAKSNANRREYMKSVADLGRFHKKMFDIITLLSSFKNNVDKVHEKFLFNDMDKDYPDIESKLRYFKNRWKKASDESYFIKSANILDFFANIATERGRALSAWEKRYPNKVKKLKNDTVSILASSERMLNILLNTLKDLAKSRASRNPDGYISGADKLFREFKAYDAGDKGFKAFYESNVKDFLEKQEFFSKEDEVIKPSEPVPPTPKEPEIKSVSPKSEEVHIPVELVEPTPKPTPSPAPIKLEPPKPTPTSIPKLPPVPKLNPGAAPLLSKEPIQLPKLAPDPNEKFDETKTTQMKTKVAPAHKKFIDSLEAMSEESPKMLALHIMKYAKTMESKSPEIAIELFKLVKMIGK